MDDHRNQHFEFGTTNPTLMEKPFWKYMVANPNLTAFDVSRHSPNYANRFQREDRAIWCFTRFGATQTFLPDGRLIQIGGEHEDSYDPDFQIYNDVVVIKNPHMTKGSHGYALPVPINFPLKREQKAKFSNSEILGTSNADDVTIYGYPEEVFPPTDFHTATYVKDNKYEFIYIIGGLGYPDSSHRRATHVYRLSLSDFTINHMKTSGLGPAGCTERHQAKLVTDKGKKVIEILTGDNGIYKLDIKTAVWETIKTRFVNHTAPEYPTSSPPANMENKDDSVCCLS